MILTTKISKKHNKNQIQEKGIITFILLGILLFYPPFFKGLFFQKEILMTHILSFGLFIIYLVNKITKGEKIEFNNPFDYIGLLFILAYILPIIFNQWANLRDALGLVLRYANFYVVYLMVKEYAREEKYKNWILNIFIISGVGTAIIGLLGAAGYVHLQDVVLGNRISSTFQYPNTLAAFLMTLFFITTGKLMKTEEIYKKILYGIAGFIMLFTFVFTYSRAAWVLFPIFAIGYLIIIPKEYKIRTLLHYITIGIPIVLLLQPFSKYTTNIESGSPKAIMVILLGMGIFTGLNILIEKFGDKLQEKQKIIYMLTAGVVLATAIFGIIAINTTQPLVFDNTGLTENKHNILQRTIKDIESNQEYILKTNIEAIGNEEGEWPWRIRVFGIDENGERHELITRNGELEETGDITIPLNTNEDTRDLAVYFENLYPETKVTFNKAQLQTDSEEVIEDIKISYKYIPENIVRRFISIDVAERSFSTRMDFYKDSFKIFKDYPIFGAGGGAWEALYPKYQSEPYFSTEAHNYFLQTLVELGSIGILLMILLVGTIVYFIFIMIKNQNLLEMTILFSILSLLAHSALDFNFSYLSIPLFMWGLIGLLDTGLVRGEDIKRISKLDREINTLIPLALVLPFAIGSIFFYGGQQSATNGLMALQQDGDVDKGYAFLDKAIGMDPFNKDFRKDMAQLQSMVENPEQQQMFLQMAEENLLRALKYVPNDDQVLEQLGMFYLRYGQFDKGFEYIEKMLEVAPMRASNYETKVNAYTMVGEYYRENGEIEKAQDIYDATLSIAGVLKDLNENLKKPIILSDTVMDTILNNRYIIEYIDRPEEIEKLDKLVYMSYLDMDEKLPRGWWTWNREDGDIQVDVTEKGAVVSNNGKDLGLLLSPQIELQPSTTYGIDLQVEGDVGEDYTQVVIHSRSGTATQFSQRPLGKPNEDATYSFTFTTTEDIEAGGQDIRFYHYGNTDKEFTIQQVMVYEMK